MKSKNKQYLSFLLAFILSFAVNFSNVFAAGNLKVHFIDVGQADSILVQAPNGKNMLIDAGETKDNAVMNYLKGLGISKLDAVVATHPHSDHISEMADIISSFDIGNFYMPKVSHTTQTFADMANALKNKGIKATEAVAGNWIGLDENLGCDIVAPNSSNYEGLNNWSAVIHLSYGNTSFLFTGDAEALSEEEILNNGLDIKSDVLKVGHHGSSTSTSSDFLKAVNPKYAVISYGEDNDYGHPHSETVEKLNNIKTYKTATDGNIVFTSDGKNITVETNVPTPEIKQPAEAKTDNTASKQVKANNNTTNTNNNKSATVYITKTGSKYHSNGCQYLRRSKIPTTLGEALSDGYSACSKCSPPR